MPSLLHEALIKLFENRPTLAPELLRDVLHQALPAYDDVEVKDATLSQIVPTEYHADLVVLLHRGTPVFGIVVEVQLRRDDDKVFTWPLYAMVLRAKYRCPTCVMVVTPDAEVARWAARRIDVGLADSWFRPLVLGPSAVPYVTDVEEARRTPELAVLSVQAHGRGESGIDIAVAALAAASGLDDQRAKLYCDLVYLAVGAAVRTKLEELMQSGAYEYQSDFAKKYIAQGRAEGKAEGKAEGHAEGEAKGRAEALLKILELRNLALSSAQRERVLACSDSGILDRWLERALVATAADAVFDD